MVLLKNESIAMGTPAPGFDLPSVDGKNYRLQDFSDSQVLVVMFICNHCPYVQAIEDRLIQLQRDYQDKSVQIVGICANDPTDYPEDSPDNLLKRWKEKNYGFPYLVDESQDVARAYGAVATPDLYVYDSNRKLAYHGRLDDNWQEPEKVTRRELAEAIDRLLQGQAPSRDQHPGMGCSIKWRK